MTPRDRDFQGLIQQLVETMTEELRQNERFLNVIRRKKGVLAAEAFDQLDAIFRSERETLTHAATVERDRIALVTEIGQLLGHPNPSRVRIAEIILHAGPEDRDELLDLRDGFRDVADELDDLLSVETIFRRHRRDQVRLYATPSRSKALIDEVKVPGPR